MPGKHVLNPPIVTVLGAGIAGLTAAHELVERGFLVQVVEAEEDPYCPGRPLVGGMAANQPARVRANIEDLHQKLLPLAAQYEKGKTGEAAEQAALAKCLLELFAFNRKSWLATEFPARVRRILYRPPEGNEQFAESVVQDLKQAQQRYRSQWIWDLVVRSVLVKDITFEGKEIAATDANLLQLVADGCRDLERLTTRELAKKLHGFSQFEEMKGIDIEKYLDDLLVPALEREFLCFRLLPQVRRGFEEAPRRARELYKAWSELLCKSFPECCLSEPASDQKVPVMSAQAPPPAAGEALPDEETAWVELQIIEQRLPGEHGFRFFPSFYRHSDDTMRRIPLFEDGRPTGRSVLDNLNPTLFQGIGFSQKDKQTYSVDESQLGWNNSDQPSKAGAATVVELNRDLPTSIEGLRDRTDRLVKRLGGTPKDAALLFAKLFRYMTTSPERRRQTYEDLKWSEFLQIDQFSKTMQQQINSAAQVLVAFSVKEADARTYGNTALQLLFDQLKDSRRVDRTLNGPTSDAWLEPWRDYLERQGVRFFCREVVRLERLDNGEVVPRFAKDGRDKSRLVSQDGHELLEYDPERPGLSPDFYVLAVNFERATDLIAELDAQKRVSDSEARDFAQTLKFWDVVQQDGLKFMTGVQFFFDAKTSLGKGHMYFPFSRWGLSSISQSEFWSRRGGVSDGYFGILSVGVCDPGKDPSRPAEKDFWHVLEQGTDEFARLGDKRANRHAVAKIIWSEIRDRIDERDTLDVPRVYHIDQKVLPPPPQPKWVTPPSGARPYPRFARFLASLAEIDRERPGRNVLDRQIVGDKEVEYSINYKRWVLCSTYMATHTRLTTMDAANESGRHAVRAILDKIGEQRDEQNAKPLRVLERDLEMANLDKHTYNGARRIYDLPDIFNPEEFEFEDLDLFRRIDRRLLKLGLPHFMDIIDFDKKLLHALEGLALYGKAQPLKDVFGLLTAGVDATLLKEIGDRYRDRRSDLERTLASLAGSLPAGQRADITKLFGQLENLAKP